MNINVHERREVWSCSFPDIDRISEVHLAGEMLVIQSNANKLFGIDKDTGEKRWELANVSYYHSYDPSTKLLTVSEVKLTELSILNKERF